VDVEAQTSGSEVLGIGNDANAASEAATEECSSAATTLPADINVTGQKVNNKRELS